MNERSPLTALAVVALLALGACGDDTTDSTATTSTTGADRSARTVDDDVVERVSDASGNTVDQGTAQFSVMVETEGTGTDADGRQPIDVDGVVDFDEERRRLTLEGPQGDLDVVIDGDVAYLELPATEDDDWMRIELDALLSDDLGFGGVAGLPFQDPEDNLRVLEGSAVHAAEVGEESIVGQETTRYELVIDLERTADDTTDDVQTAVENTATRTGLSELEIDVWVDADDLIRRVAYTIDLSKVTVDESDEDGSVEADTEGTVTVTVDYTDFGLDVDIDIPDDADVVDLDEDAVRDAVGSADTGERTTSTTSTGADRDTTTSTDGTGTTTSTTDG